MKLYTIVQLLTLVTTALAGVIAADKRNDISSTPCEAVAPTTITVMATQNQIQIETTTETQVTTITAQPDSVTVALQGPDAISSSLSSAFSVESQQLEINSQLAPNNPFRSQHPLPSSATRFTRTLIVPVIEATKTFAASGQTSATDVYFIGENDGTTTWLSNLIPHESMTIGTTTVTLSPVPSVSTIRTVRSRVTESATRTNTLTMTVERPNAVASASVGGFGGVGYQGWNTSASALAPASTSALLMDGGGSGVLSSFQVVTTRQSSAIITTTVQVSGSATSRALPTNAYGSTANITFPTAGYGYEKRSDVDGRRRAVCEWITATMRGTPVSWPNNYDGSKTVNCATFTSSTQQSQPALPPTMVTVTVTRGEMPSSDENPASSSAPATQTIVPVSSTSTSAAPAAATSCGVSGDFTLDFDTLPQFFAPDNDTAPFPPIFNPYRHLFFSSGWAYVPPPTTPVVPQNGSHLAVYVPSASETNSSVSQSPNAGDVPPGSFGAGPRAYDNAYWFDAETLYVFCDNGAEDPAVTCDVVVTAYQWDEDTQSETVLATQHFPQPPCPGYNNCRTNEIFLDTQFRGLSSLSLYAIVDGKQKMFFIDTVQLSWWNNTCEAGRRRASQI
ncbi:hypothetical protein EPUS_00231 [Endocarpon pusillum Z07020]|uniref:DUF7371 domain-containing protein n=1 Tax=Endocarpon pusillum (strain Z07020 / HMAS-L-300199) TaxID=1263415 RepID=U1GSQ7_ENDPU|nr:uncharacterized protein EPUS_00231 [Endocarpon pusillum Z07020]ERF75438.1 hypothetical protein EPUS_00231 [Endocarpon pusillum Z07020]